MTKNCIYYRKVIYENVELDLLKDPRFVSTLVGLGFAFVSDVTYLAMEPMLLFSYGYTKVKIEKALFKTTLISTSFYALAYGEPISKKYQS